MKRKNVNPASLTETFAALKFYIDNLALGQGTILYQDRQTASDAGY
ncbi:MAG: hypothetical protein U5L72_08280 [Bacteroidales bacterium]|nr:hypothetical protein [Bacteroidales bacterium]